MFVFANRQVGVIGTYSLAQISLVAAAAAAAAAAAYECSTPTDDNNYLDWTGMEARTFTMSQTFSLSDCSFPFEPPFLYISLISRTKARESILHIILHILV